MCRKAVWKEEEMSANYNNQLLLLVGSYLNWNVVGDNDDFCHISSKCGWKEADDYRVIFSYTVFINKRVCELVKLFMNEAFVLRGLSRWGGRKLILCLSMCRVRYPFLLLFPLYFFFLFTVLGETRWKRLVDWLWKSQWGVYKVNFFSLSEYRSQRKNYTQ